MNSRSRSSCLVIGLVVAALGCGPKGAAPQNAAPAEETPPFHGLFVHATAEYSNYLLIMPDGMACTITLGDGTPEQVKAMFHCDDPVVGKGSYQITGDTLVFSSVHESGTVDYEAVRVGNDLQVKSHSQINDHRGEDTYLRVP